MRFDGAQILDDLVEVLARYVAFPSDGAGLAVALWVAHCHALDAFESTPRLALLSPEKGSGKTRTLEVLALVVPGADACGQLRSRSRIRRRPVHRAEGQPRPCSRH